MYIHDRVCYLSKPDYLHVFWLPMLCTSCTSKYVHVEGIYAQKDKTIRALVYTQHQVLYTFKTHTHTHTHLNNHILGIHPIHSNKT